MTGALVAMALGSVAAILAVRYLHRALRALALVLKPAWFWFSGHCMDGEHKTNATWAKRSYGDRAVLKAGAIWWHHWPRRLRAAIRTGGTILALAIAYGMVAATFITLACLCGVTAAVAALAALYGIHVLRNWQHERHHVRPLELTLTRKLRVQPDSIEVNVDRDDESGADVITGVVIEWPPDTEIGAPEKDQVLEAVTTRLPLDSPDATWKLRGRERSVTFTPSEPPPSYVSWDDVAAAVRAAALNELVFGIGKRDAIVTAKYSESPHLCIPGGSGGGKSNLAAFLLLQELMRGSLIVNLDPKWTSHLWLQGLPNVISAHDAPSLHEALCWLGRELDRRTRAAYYSANGTGRVRGRTGDRIIVLAEELNYGTPGLKDHHAELRAEDKNLPKKSKAISALQGMSCAGRASDMHEWLVAQLLTVESTGVKDSTIRTNAGVKAMIRHDKPGWDMAVGKHVPMPQPSSAAGRIHVVTVEGIPRETQVPYLHLVAEDGEDPAVADEAVQWARELAVSGDVAKIPIGGEFGVPPQLIPACVLDSDTPSLTAGQGPETAGQRTDEPVLVTLRQACAEGTLKFDGRDPLGAARKAAQRPGFPAKAGLDDKEKLYYRAELKEWQDGKVRVIR